MKILLVLDMQKGFLEKPEYNGLKEKINQLISSNDYDKVIYTRFINKNNSMYETYLNWHRLKDEDSQKIVVDIIEDSEILDKSSYGLDYVSLQKIKEYGATSIDICGVQSEACIYAIAMQLWDMEIFPNILINYIRTHSKIDMENIFLHQFGNVDKKY